MNGPAKRHGGLTLALAGLLGLAGCTGETMRDAGSAARLRVASVAEASGQPEVAISVLATLAKSSPEDADVQARYVRALARAGNLADAESTATRALHRNPASPSLLRALGQIRLLEGKSTEALQNFQAVLRAAPEDVVAATGRGIALDLLGQHEQAQASYRTALAADPQNLAALNNLALSLVLADRPEEAIPMLEPLTRRSDATERIRNNLVAAKAVAGAPNSTPAEASSSGSQESLQDVPPQR